MPEHPKKPESHVIDPAVGPDGIIFRVNGVDGKTTPWTTQQELRAAADQYVADLAAAGDQYSSYVREYRGADAGNKLLVPIAMPEEPIPVPDPEGSSREPWINDPLWFPQPWLPPGM